ncbi:MAG: putative heme transporter [Solirubrobacteraceae bacterium]|nr:putative heme transporter [Solirubrobacteraceae bacterium]
MCMLTEGLARTPSPARSATVHGQSRLPPLPLPPLSVSPDEPPAAALLPDRRWLALRVALAAGVLGAVALAVTSLPGLGDVRARLADASPGWLALALALEVASCLACVAVFRGVFCRRLPWRLSYEVAIAAQGTNVLLPSGGAGGLAVAAWALRRTGMSAERIGRRSVAFYLLTSVVNFATAALAGGLLALGILAGGPSLALTALPALAATVVIAGVLALPRMLASRGDARPRTGRVGRILTWVRGALSGGVRDAGLLVRSGNPLIIGGAIGYMAFDVAALAAAFAAIGAVPPVGLLLLAYVVGQLGNLIPLPGGVGGADGGLIAALVLYGTPLSGAAAAVLAYRAFQLGLPALLGGVAVLRLPGVVERAPDTGQLCAPPRESAVRRGGGLAVGRVAVSAS